MSLASTALDLTKVDMKFVRDNVLRYLPNDTTCYHADPSTERVLLRKQKATWGPIHKFILSNTPLKVAPAISNSLTLTRNGLQHEPELIALANTYVNSLDHWYLTLLQSAVVESKSFLVGVCYLHRGITPTEAIHAGRVEEEFQLEQWGLVEGGHDLDRLNAGVSMMSVRAFMDLLELKEEEGESM